MFDNNLNVGDDNLIEIQETSENNIPYIKILSNNKFWCIVCCKIGPLGTESKKMFSNINSHCKNKRHKKQCEIHKLAMTELKPLTSAEFIGDWCNICSFQHTT